MCRYPAAVRFRVWIGLLLSLMGAAAGCREPAGPPFHPGVTKIAFASNRFIPGNLTAPASAQIYHYEIYVMGPDGSNPTRLTHDSADDVDPAWSPDGRRIAFSCYPAICVINADGSGRRVLTGVAGYRDFTDHGPAWSPDGHRIVFERLSFRESRYGDGDLYAMNADGAFLTQLTAGSSFDMSPNWSPDGRRIVFTRDGRLYVMNADGSNAAALTSDTAEAYDPAWSPDGRTIAFTRSPTSAPHIWLVNADGSGLAPLTSGDGQDSHVTWSPDGSRIAFMRVNVDRDIFVMNADGSHVVNVTSSPTDDYAPAWAR